MEPLILASGSPRRKQLLAMLGIAAVVRPPAIAESRRVGESPRDYALRLAQEKAAAVPGDLVLAADTIVLLADEVLEKPRDDEHALVMLRKLQGRTHQVITAVALKADGAIHEAVDTTAVTFRPARDAVLREYIATGEPRDKAGAYGIQGYGAALIERIDGDFFTVMGLPLRRVLDLLAETGRPYRFPRPDAGTL